MVNQFEELLEGFSKSLLEADWPSWREHVRYPLTLVASHGAAVSRDELQLMKVFNHSVDQLRSHGVRAIALQPFDFQQLDASKCNGTFAMHLYHSRGLLQPVVEVSAFMGLLDGRLKLNMLLTENTDEIALMKFEVAKKSHRLEGLDGEEFVREYIH